MEIRPIKPKERIEASKIQSLAFDYGADFTSGTNDNYTTCRAAFNEDGKMCSCMEVMPFEAYFNGSIVKMAGIGGVASLPEERRKGYVRELFRQCMVQMKEDGQWLSYLHPFSHVYYRQFGYEAGVRKLKATIPLDAFRQYASTGSVWMHQPQDGIEEIRAIYEAFARDKNYMLRRSLETWKKKLGDNPYKSKRYIYVWYDGGRLPGSYLVLRPNGENMTVEELAWVSPEALRGMFGFISGFAGRYTKLVYEAPEFLNLCGLFPEPSQIGTEFVCAGMGRIVDVEQILRISPAPEGNGKLALQIRDDFLPWNNDTFAVSWSGGETVVARKTCPPDLCCSVQAFTALVAGSVSPEDLVNAGTAQISGSGSTIERMFAKKKLYINDCF